MILTEDRKTEYSCLMLYCKQPQIIKELHKEIDKNDLYHKEGEEYGLEKESHITVLYGLLPEVTWGDIQEYLEPIDKFEIIAPKLSLFENNEFDVLKLDIKCSLLNTINSKLCDNLPYKSDFPNYHPHMTVAYLKKGCGKKYTQDFLKKIDKIMVMEYVFSKTDGTKEHHKTIE